MSNSITCYVYVTVDRNVKYLSVMYQYKTVFSTVPQEDYLVLFFCFAFVCFLKMTLEHVMQVPIEERESDNS